jgi:hypothetical protein
MRGKNWRAEASTELGHKEEQVMLIQSRPTEGGLFVSLTMRILHGGVTERN